MKTTKKDFELFKSECLRLMNEWKLNQISIFEHKYISSDAKCAFNSHGEVTYCLSTDVEPIDTKKNEYIKYLAKHEVIHCLIGNFAGLASVRFTTEDRMIDEEERLVRHLQKLL